MTGYAAAAETYLQRGWSPLPIPAGKKAYPPEGFTGQDGDDPDAEQVAAWAQEHPDGNLALRLPPGVLGIDVDAYDGKPGGDTFAGIEKAHGPFPATWRSSSRADDAMSGIRIYRTPDALDPATLSDGWPGIDLIHHGLRYMLAAPSIHPTGTPYRWYGPNGETVGPSVSELPTLNGEHIKHLQRQCTCFHGTSTVGVAVKGRTPGEAHSEAMAALDAGHGRHDTTRDAILALVRFQEKGDPDAGGFLAELRDRYRAAVTAGPGEIRSPREAEREWQRMVDGAEKKVAHTPTSPPAAIDFSEPEPVDDDAIAHIQPVDFASLEDRVQERDQWLVEPVIAAGRRTHIHSVAGLGKSLLSLYLAACIATGRAVFHRPAGEPETVDYLDAEMTEDDLAERLSDMGFDYQNDTTLQAHLRYYLHPDLPPLDTKEGGELVLALALRDGAVAVFIDTVTSQTEGNENDADTYRAMARYTTTRLVANGIASIVLDHEGKDAKKGARGSSAKADPADVVWRLTKGKTDSLVLTQKKRRMGWVPENIGIDKTDYPLTFTLPPQTISHDAALIVKLLDELDVPNEAGRPTAAKALREAGEHAQESKIAEAVKWRKRRVQGSGTGHPQDPRYTLQEQATTETDDSHTPQGAYSASEQSGTGTTAPTGTVVPPHRGHSVPGPNQEEQEQQRRDNLPDPY